MLLFVRAIDKIDLHMTGKGLFITDFPIFYHRSSIISLVIVGSSTVDPDSTWKVDSEDGLFNKSKPFTVQNF